MQNSSNEKRQLSSVNSGFLHSNSLSNLLDKKTLNFNNNCSPRENSLSYEMDITEAIDNENK